MRGCGRVSLCCCPWSWGRACKRGRGGEFGWPVRRWRMSFRLCPCQYPKRKEKGKKKRKTHKHSVKGRLGRWSRCHPRTGEIANDLSSRWSQRLITRLPTHLPTGHHSCSRRCRLRRRSGRWCRKRRRLSILHLCPYFLFFIFSFILMFQVLHDCHDAVRVSFLFVLGDTVVVEDLLPFGGHTGVFCVQSCVRKTQQ